ncbi:sensor histidine kinase [Bizionia sp. KMM 8389]
MKIYHQLSRLPFLKKYSYKFLFVAFLGIHLPLLGVVFYSLFVTSISKGAFVVVTLVLTLIATAITLKVLNALLYPIVQGEKALMAYIDTKYVPDLPTTYTDEVGVVLKNIQHTIESLEEVNQEKQEVVELISHDLRTPVVQTLQILEFLKLESADSKDYQSHLATLKEVAEKQLKFLEGMLKILKDEHVEVSAENFEVLTISHIVEGIILENKQVIKAKNLKIVNAIPEDLKLKAHAFGMKQVLENIMSNAIKFSEDTGEIKLTAAVDEKQVCLMIKDYGIGFNENTKRQLFKKFIPGHLGVNGEPSTGLGLYLSKKIIEKHGGTIKPYSSGVGKGAEFEICIPKKINPYS